MNAIRLMAGLLKFSALVITFQVMPIVFLFLFACWHTPDRILNIRMF